MMHSVVPHMSAFWSYELPNLRSIKTTNGIQGNSNAIQQALYEHANAWENVCAREAERSSTHHTTPPTRSEPWCHTHNGLASPCATIAFLP